jgi:hypothetical protein
LELVVVQSSNDPDEEYRGSMSYNQLMEILGREKSSDPLDQSIEINSKKSSFTIW